ncbi:MAG TPA: SAM-dependent methyltransferase [Bacteroidetes bacterium]|nr:SAM-dependent methyltransferase [Bacteroidota bacterium]
MNERTFSVADAYKLEDPERPKWLPPNEVITSLEIQSGMSVADIGAGTGYFTLPIARAVGSDGKVHAVDFQTGMLDLLGKKLLEPNAPTNISLIHGTATHTTLPSVCADLVFLANVWHEVDDHALVLKEAARILRKSGRMAILDWRPNVQQPPGPPIDHRISAKTVAETLKLNGWNVERSGNVGKYSYLILARRG